MPFNSIVGLDKIKKDWDIHDGNWSIDSDNAIIKFIKTPDSIQYKSPTDKI